MKHFAILILTVVLLQAGLANAKDFSCTGYYGKFTVNFNLQDKTYFLEGNILSVDKKEWKHHTCAGVFTKQARGNLYFSANEICPADYIVVQPSLLNGSTGNLALANKSGGDTHDLSGYAYRSFTCSDH